MRIKKNWRKKSLASTLGVLLFVSTLASFNAWSLPDPARGLPATILKDLGANPALVGSPILLDHQNIRTVYVGPATRKTEGGGFNFVNFGKCNTLKQAYDTAYLVPSGDPAMWSDLALKKSFSPFFDFSFGNSVYENTLLRQLADEIQQADLIKQKHADLYSAYASTQLVYLNAVQRVKTAQDMVTALDTAVIEAGNRLAVATTPDEIALDRQLLESARKDRADRGPALKETLHQALVEQMAAEGPYAKALGDVTPYLVDSDALVKRSADIMAIFSSIQTVSQNSWKTETDTVSGLLTTPVGTASMAYSLYTNEVSALASVLGTRTETVASWDSWLFGVQGIPANQLQVLPLPLVDVALDPGTEVAVTAQADGSGNVPSLNAKGTLSKSSVLRKTIGTPLPADYSIFHDAQGNPVKTNVAQIQNEGAKSFDSIITLGAYCMTSSQGAPVIYAPNDLNGHAVKVAGVAYAGRSAPIMHQAIALNYKYYAKAEPFDVSCTLDVSKYRNMTENKGSEGFLFWQHSWDDTQRTLIQSNGVTCKLKDAPAMLNDQAAIDYRNKIEQSLSQEVMAEYVIEYADHWDVLNQQPANVPDAPSTTVGPAMTALCGLNMYCQIANVAWKAADALFGNRSGESGTTDTLSGTITRHYIEDTYRKIPASTSIDMLVPAPVAVN